MSDEADLADEHTEREMAIRRKSIDTKPEFEPTGECLNCSEPLAEGARWCDKNCQLDFLNDLKRRKRQ